jgi:hypothetical protein
MLASTPVISTVSSSSGFDAAVLSRLRLARVRARLVLNAIDTAGIALRDGWIDGETALAMVDEANLLDFVVGRSS